MALWITETFSWNDHLALNIFNVICATSMAISMVVYYRRRNIFPLRGRGTHAVLFSCAAMIGIEINVAARGPYWPCVIDFAFFNLFAYAGAGAYAYRVAVLLIKNDIAKEIQLQPFSPSQSKSCLHHPRFRPYFKFGRAVLVLIPFGFLMSIIFFGIAIAFGDHLTCRGGFNLAVNLTLVLVMGPILLVLAWRLREYPADGRKISAEFRATAFGLPISIMLQIGLTQIGGLYTGPLIMDLIGTILMFTSLVYPVYLSYSYNHSDSSSITRGSQRNFEELLESDDFRFI